VGKELWQELINMN